MAAFNGRWQLVSSEKFEDYMKAIGIDAENLKKGLELLNKTGDGGLEEVYTVTDTTIKRDIYVGGKAYREPPPVPLAKEVEGAALDGRPIKITITVEGSKITRKEKGNGYESLITIEVSGDTKTDTFKTGSVVCVRKYKKV